VKYCGKKLNGETGYFMARGPINHSGIMEQGNGWGRRGMKESARTIALKLPLISGRGE